MRLRDKGVKVERSKVGGLASMLQAYAPNSPEGRGGVGSRVPLESSFWGLVFRVPLGSFSGFEGGALGSAPWALRPARTPCRRRGFPRQRPEMSDEMAFAES